MSMGWETMANMDKTWYQNQNNDKPTPKSEASVAGAHPG